MSDEINRPPFTQHPLHGFIMGLEQRRCYDAKEVDDYITKLQETIAGQKTIHDCYRMTMDMAMTNYLFQIDKQRQALFRKRLEAAEWQVRYWSLLSTKETDIYYDVRNRRVSTSRNKLRPSAWVHIWLTVKHKLEAYIETFNAPIELRLNKIITPEMFKTLWKHREQCLKG